MVRGLGSSLKWGVLWILYGLSFLGRLLPKDDTLWVFGADGGERFADNAKYLFLHVVNERADIRPIWLSDSEQTRTQLRAAGYETYPTDSLRGLYYTVRARYIFVVLGRGDVAWWATGATTVVNLWHGCPMKRIGADRQGDVIEGIEQAVFAIRESAFDRLVTTADSLRSMFVSGFGLDRDSVVSLGYPRNDVLRGSVPDADIGVADEVASMVEDRARSGPVIAYMPTFRSGFGLSHGETDETPLDAEVLHDLLEIHDGTFFVKHHPHEQDGLDAEVGDRIVELPADVDIYPLLEAVDVLVTDYSSVYLDYLHLDRPVIFFPYDLESYAARPGFYFEYDEVTPGPTPQTFPAFLDAVDEILSGRDEYADERREVREQFFDEPEARAASRVADHFAG